MSKIQYFAANSKGRDFICGDIHGMYRELLVELKKADFNNSRDRLFCVGDLVDRGHQSYSYRKFLKQPWFYSLMGNHEVLACKALVNRDFQNLQQWVMNGGDWIHNVPQDDMPAIADDFRCLPLAFQIELGNGTTIGITHAEISADDWQDITGYLETLAGDEYDFAPESQATTLLWSRKLIKAEDTRVCDNIDHVFHGHTPTEEITTLGNRTYLDLGCFYSGKIAVINPEEFLSG